MRHTALRLGLIVGLYFVGGPKALGIDRYVSAAGGHVAPFTTWPTAATNIQTAIDASGSGDTIWVTNGTYNVGGIIIPGGSLTNRIALTKPLTVRSGNGPERTLIEGDTN